MAALVAATSLLTTALVAACGSFGSSDGPAAATPDGSVAVDGSSAEDAGADAPDRADRDAACIELVGEHFDTFPPNGFTATSGNEGDAGLSDVHALSRPTALFATGTATPGNGTQETYERDFMLDGGFVTGSLSLAYDVYLSTNPAAYAELGCTLELRNAADQSTRLLFARNSDSSLSAKADDDFGGSSPSTDLAPSSGEGWQHVQVVVRPLTATTARAGYAVTPAGSATVPLDVDVLADVDRVRLLCGIDFANAKDASSSTTTVWIDDLSLRICP
jgi:hypothetical protein